MEKKFSLIKSQIRNVKFGKNCTVIEPSNLYECELGNDVFVGPFVEITKGVKIGDRTRVSSHSFICNLVNIGKDCFIAHGVMFTNDLFKEGKISRDENMRKLKKRLENAPKPARAARELRMSLRRGKSGVVYAGGFVQAQLGPLFQRLLPSRWLFRFVHWYHDLRQGR